ncbi:LacI family transcriptional regulator [Phytoactinopolyspora alkaliphila]|uniref:LacI family transcriptional regulator n=1 Tax=Phytoactinopolyspora alkaliphila TaxID=1783498 RepID=A0A6N9YKC2_9ACTN|nr:LacI family DNA-binding transcriptional regulator [Phytoactinopolyspora alkaliphila]NED95319.1 LacI family transcriptional regulator [Phytoactinopolyspora alkaliphila]
MPVTMREVAQRAGVSVKTVSNVVNGYPYIREATRSRVIEAIDALGYQMNISARSLRASRTGIIALAVPELRMPYFAELSEAVIRIARENDLTVLIEQTGAERERELALLSSARGHLVDGVIFSPLALGADDADRLNVPFPMVLLGERIFRGPVDHVSIDNVAASREVVRHLISNGRRRIALIGMISHEGVGTAALRFQGYLEALAEAGLAPSPELVLPAGPWNRSAGAEATNRLLDSGVEFDAVFGLNDTLALGALRALLSRGIRVPNDVAVAGFDDIEETRFSTPTLTTVDPGRDQIARTAVELLVSRMKGQNDEVRPREIFADYALHPRQSTGEPLTG